MWEGPKETLTLTENAQHAAQTPWPEGQRPRVDTAAAR
jgi:hypothetical protein